MAPVIRKSSRGLSGSLQAVVLAAVLVFNALTAPVGASSEQCSDKPAQTDAAIEAEAQTTALDRSGPQESTGEMAAPHKAPPALELEASAPAGSSPPPAASASAAATSGRAPAPQEFVLPNGLKVLVLEDRSFPVVSCLMWYRVGSRHENFGATGLCHLVEHLLFRNVGSFRNGQIGTSIARLGGQFNGYTSDDFTAFFTTLPAGRLELALRIEAERMRGARFNDADVNEEIGNIQREFEAESRDPYLMLSREVRASLFQQHPYHNPTMGWRRDVENLTAAQAKTFYDQFFWPNNAVLVLAGDINLRGALPLIQKHFLSIPRSARPIPSVNARESPQLGERRLSIKHPGKSEILQVAYHAPAAAEADAAAMAVLEKLLSAGAGGRLRARLVESRLCTAAAACFEFKRDPGLFSVICTASPDQAGGQQKILEAVDATLNQLKAQPVSDAELRKARNQAEFAFLSERDGPYRAGFQLGLFDTVSAWQSAGTWAELIRRVSAADVQRVAKRYFDSDNRVVGWLAGAGAPRSPAKGIDESRREDTPPATRFDHARVTGYKEDDSAAGPRAGKRPSANRDNLPDLPSAITSGATAITSGAAAITGGAATLTGSAAAITNKVTQAAATTVTSTLNTLPAAIGATANAIGNISTAIGGLPGSVARAGGNRHTGDQALEPRVEKRVLKNGLTLLVWESQLSPIVHLSGSVRAGESLEPQGKRGMSLLAAQVMNHGPAKMAPGQFQQLQEDLGLSAQWMLKFQSSPETVDFSTRCLSRNLQAHLDLIAAALTTPATTEAAVERAREELNARLKRGESEKERVNRAIMQSLLSEVSPLRPADITEKIRGISGITAADLSKYIGENFTPAATTISIAGDITAERAVQMAEKAFASRAFGGNPKTFKAEPAEHRVLKTSIPIGSKPRHAIGFGQLIPITPGHDDWGSLLAADCVLDNHPLISRVSRRLNADPLLSRAVNEDAVETRMETMANYTSWSIIASVEPNAVPSAVRSLRDELEKLSRSGVSNEELQEVKRYLFGSILVRNLATLSSVARTALDSHLRSGDANGYLSALASIRGATADSVNRVIRDAFKPEQCTLVVAGNAQTIKAVNALTLPQPVLQPLPQDQPSGNEVPDNQQPADVKRSPHVN